MKTRFGHQVPVLTKNFVNVNEDLRQCHLSKNIGAAALFLLSSRQVVFEWGGRNGGPFGVTRRFPYSGSVPFLLCLAMLN
jgi:hypothetical protein